MPKPNNCEHPNLRPSLTHELHCNGCNKRWQGYQAILVLLGKVNTLEAQIDAIAGYQTERIHDALLQLGLDSCDRCGVFFPSTPNPKGLRYKPEENSTRICCICRDCLAEAATDENCTWWDDDSDFAKQQIAQWWIKFYGSDRPAFVDSKHDFAPYKMSNAYHLINTQIKEIRSRAQ